MIHLIHPTDKEGGFSWIKIIQWNQLLKYIDPTDPTDPTDFQVYSQSNVTADRWS
jgi:hypothetical protein